MAPPPHFKQNSQILLGLQNPTGPGSLLPGTSPLLPFTYCLPATRHPSCSLTCQVAPTLGFRSCRPFHVERCSFSGSPSWLPHFIHTSAQMSPLQREVALSKIAPINGITSVILFSRLASPPAIILPVYMFAVVSPSRIRFHEAGLGCFVSCCIPRYIWHMASPQTCL